MTTEAAEATPHEAIGGQREAVARRYEAIRRQTERLGAPLSVEDMLLQSAPETSPPKWHIAHTTWFFETFVLAEWEEEHEPVDPLYAHIFNSYYNQIGAQWPKERRHLISRPSLAQVHAYRRDVDRRIRAFLAEAEESAWRRLGPILETGLQHEQQHQELFLMDVKHAFATHPARPGYGPLPPPSAAPQPTLQWHRFEPGLTEIGHDGDGFCYDNEQPRHRTYLAPFEIASRLVTNAEYLAFIEDGGYERPELWLDEGWQTIRGRGQRAPLYWHRRDGEWWTTTLGGDIRVRPAEPVAHVTYFEADAFARWAGARLPSEAEWEVAARELARGEGAFLESGRYHPRVADESPGAQFLGDLWEWTASPYVAYPGYAPPAGALGEYNGKFMCNQFVLRGGCCATPRSHTRVTYRNFFPPGAQWMFSGIRLARDG